MRYSRQSRLAEIGLAGQKAISESRVQVPGSGLASEIAATYLVGAGVGHVCVDDASVARAARALGEDRVEIHSPARPRESAPMPLLPGLEDKSAQQVAAGALFALRALKRIWPIPLAILWVNSPAYAGLRDEAHHVSREWTKAGAQVRNLPPRFIHEDESLSVPLPPLSPARLCTTVAVLGPRGMSFRLRVPPNRAEGEERPASIPSTAGVALASLCDRPIRHLTIVSDSGRGALQILVATSDVPILGLAAVLPERVGSPLPVAPDPGPAPTFPPLVWRAASAEQRTSQEGGRVHPRLGWTAGAEGTGGGPVSLEVGCHHIKLYAPDPPRGSRRRFDLDAELREESSDRLVAKDQTEASDVTLEFCIAEEVSTVLRFTGAMPHAAVVGSHVAWPLPAHLPELWGTDATARMASAMRRRSSATPKSKAIFLAQGTSASAIPMPVQPGSCYLLTAAISSGSARSLGLRASLGPKVFWDDRGTPSGGNMLTFCTGRERRALLEVDARGPSATWGLALFSLHHNAWSAE